MNLKFLLTICSRYKNGIQVSYIPFARRAYIPLTYTLKRKKLQRKREELCKTVTSDIDCENEWILHLKVISIALHFEELETLIESFGVNKPSLVCCSEPWTVQSSAEDIYN